MEKHTALPWQAKGWGIFGNGNHPVAEMIVGGRTEATANARYIVTACNAYPALIRALDEAVMWIDEEEQGAKELIAQCRAALALAKGEQSGNQ